MADAFTDIHDDELRRLLALRHHDPHALLGAHPLGDGRVVVRALRPEAESVRVLLDDEPNGSEDASHPMRLRHPAGLFEAVLPARRPPHRLPLRYRLEVRERGGRVYTMRSPYAFLPSLGELDLHLLGEGTHQRPYDKLGAHLIEMDGVRGVSFAVWAPAAEGVSVVGDFNGWDGRLDPMRLLGGSGIWELFVPDLGEGALYKFEIRTRGGGLVLKTDPYAFAMELPPSTASIVSVARHRFTDDEWMAARGQADALRRPLSILEVHLGSWRRVPEEGDRMLSYRELAARLGDYAVDMGFTHVELLPVMEHPFAGSWGYQVSGYFAPTARHGDPDDFRYFVDELHRRGVGVILDWVPAHFPKDEFCLGRFDGTALYEHLDPRQGEHPDWGTFVFNFGRDEVRSFLLASADWWLRSFHIDGLRVDAVASMIYLDYSRREGEWVPNRYGGRENLEAISFLRTLGEQAHARHPGALLIAEESTAWPGVSRPTYVGGLGFGFKWDMGWMHDTLAYFQKDPIHRRYHHDHLTFGFLYAWSENFVLPLSHDEVVHGKGALLAKMPGDRWQRFANLRALYGYMWSRPGKKLLFMGGELGQWREWNHDHSLDWHLLDEPDHRGVQSLVRELHRLYRDEPALWEADVEPAGFQWIDPHDADDNVIAFARWAPSQGRVLLSVCNFSPVVRGEHRVGVPHAGTWRVVLDTDEERWGGSGARRDTAAEVVSEPVPWHGCAQSIRLRLPPLGVLWLVPA